MPAPTSSPASPVGRPKSGRAHSVFQEGQSSKGGSETPLAAPPVGQPYAVRSPDGAIIPASAYDWRRGDILVEASA